MVENLPFNLDGLDWYSNTEKKNRRSNTCLDWRWVLVELRHAKVNLTKVNYILYFRQNYDDTLILLNSPSIKDAFRDIKGK